MNVLVIACHPDDEVLGCGGTILRHVNKEDKVFLCIVTNAIKCLKLTRKQIKQRRKEALASSNLLNIKKTFFLELPSMRLDTLPISEVVNKLNDVIKKVKPEIVYTHHISDLNQDHRVIHNASLIATRPFTDSTIRKVISYEIPSSTTYRTGKNNFNPNMFVDIGIHLKTKKNAMSLYKSEIRTYPHPRSEKGIEIYALFRGLMCGKKYAEAFELIREIL